MKQLALKLFFSSFFLACTVHASGFSCGKSRVIHQKPIDFNELRVSLTQDYQHSHYGIDSESIEIEPKMIVLHWTCIADLETTYRIFKSEEFPKNSPRLKELPDKLNVSSHFIVDRDGSIYQLMPDNWMARQRWTPIIGQPLVIYN